MRFILIVILSTFFSCGGGLDAPIFTPRAESELQDCEVSGIGEERDETLLIRGRVELEALHKQPCRNYRGVISLSGNGIENLMGLQNLRKVAGLSISGLRDLRTLDGIEALEITGTRSLSISDNPELTSIAALNAPEVLALAPANFQQEIWVSISDNPKLESLKGLENLRDLSKGGVAIFRNTGLKNLEGLNNIEVLGLAKIYNNYGLESLDGLDSVVSGGSILLEANTVLHNISDALPRLRSLDYLTVERNDKVSPCEVEAIAARVDIGEVFASDNGGTQPCD